MDGIDRYEAQRIAEDAARSAAEEAKREVGYDVDRLRDEIRQVRSELEEEREWRRAAIDEIHESIAETREIARKHEHPELTS